MIVDIGGIRRVVHEVPAIPELLAITPPASLSAYQISHFEVPQVALGRRAPDTGYSGNLWCSRSRVSAQGCSDRFDWELLSIR